MTNMTIAKQQTPWGEAQLIENQSCGIFFVSTASHGGFYVPDEMLSAIPVELQLYAAKWSGSKNWYEEDECAAIPLHYFDFITGDKQLAHAIVGKILMRLKEQKQ